MLSRQDMAWGSRKPQTWHWPPTTWYPVIPSGFTCLTSSVMMQKRVISAPVPAVVFTATSGGISMTQVDVLRASGNSTSLGWETRLSTSNIFNPQLQFFRAYPSLRMPCTVTCLGYASCTIMSLAQVPRATLAWCSCQHLRNPWCFLHWRLACWWPWHNRGVNHHQKTPQSRSRCPSASWPRLSCAAQGTKIWGGTILWDPMSWWFQAMWKVLLKLDHLPRYGRKSANIINAWNHHQIMRSYLE